MGQHMHKIFEQAATIEQINIKVDQLAKQALIADEEAANLRSAIDQAMTDAAVREWFTAEWDDVKTEVDIITAEDRRRPDRVMIKGERAVVVDYKFSNNISNRHDKQVKEYMDLLRQMELYNTIEGYVWYVPLGKVRRVEL